MENRFVRGYKSTLDKEVLLNFNKTYSKPSLFKGIMYIFGYHVSILLILFLSFQIYLAKNISFLSIIIFPITLILISRQLRALENVIHFGSHYNLSTNKKLNDLLLDLFCAYPLIQNIKSYRNFHFKHHGRYGSEVDPCYIRFKRFLTCEHKTFYTYTKFIFKNLPSYILEFYKELGLKKLNLLIYVLYNIFIFFILSIFINIKFASFSLIIMCISLFTILPLIRSIAEYGEHNYKKSNELFSTTFNNLSLSDFLVFHPAGDGFHIVHHLYPAITWWNQKKAHNYLLKNDKTYLKAINRTKFSDKYTLM